MGWDRLNLVLKIKKTQLNLLKMVNLQFKVALLLSLIKKVRFPFNNLSPLFNK